MTRKNKKAGKKTNSKTSNKTIMWVFIFTLFSIIYSSSAVLIGLIIPDLLPWYGIGYCICQGWLIVVLLSLYDTPFRIIKKWWEERKFLPINFKGGKHEKKKIT